MKLSFITATVKTGREFLQDKKHVQIYVYVQALEKIGSIKKNNSPKIRLKNLDNLLLFCHKGSLHHLFVKQFSYFEVEANHMSYLHLDKVVIDQICSYIIRAFTPAANRGSNIKSTQMCLTQMCLISRASMISAV